MKKENSLFDKFINEVLDDYKDWADLENPIDNNRKKLKVGDYVKMDDLSPFINPIENKWKIISFNQGTSAGVEAIIQNKKGKNKRSEPVRYLLKTK